MKSLWRHPIICVTTALLSGLCPAQAIILGLPEPTVSATLTRSLPPAFPIYVAPFSLAVLDPGNTGLSEGVSSRIGVIIASHPTAFTSSPTKARLHFTLSLETYTKPTLKPKKRANDAYDESMDGAVTATLSSDELSALGRGHDLIEMRTAAIRHRVPDNLSPDEGQQYRVDALMNDLVLQVESCLYGSTESIEVKLPGGTFKTASQLAAAGQWGSMLSMLRLGRSLPGGADESLRLYAIGVAREALAYQQTDSSIARAELLFARNDYLAAEKTYPRQPYLTPAEKRVSESASRMIGLGDGSMETSRDTASNLDSAGVLELERDGVGEATVSIMAHGEERKTSTSAGFSGFGGIRSTTPASRQPASAKSTSTTRSETLNRTAQGVVTRSSRGYDSMFPWPPLASSSRSVFPAALTNGGKQASTLAEVDTILLTALRSRGYLEVSHYAVPDGGFALATKMEQIDATGTPLPLPDRWTLGKQQLREMNLGDWARSLFLAPAGYYRVIVFVVSKKSLSTQGSAPKSEEARYWLLGGTVQLPAGAGLEPVTSDTVCTALIYEFRRDKDRNVQFLEKDATDANTQLKNSGLLTVFRPQ